MLRCLLKANARKNKHTLGSPTNSHIHMGYVHTIPKEKATVQEKTTTITMTTIIIIVIIVVVVGYFKKK